MPILMSTGKFPAPSGRNTSALSLAPSRIGMSTSFSTFILYWGTDALLSLRVATCSCTVPPNGWPSRPTLARTAATEEREYGASGGAPDLARSIHDKAQLRNLAGFVHGVAADAAGKSALWAECELLQRGVLGRFVDAAFKLVLGLELAGLRRDQTEDSDLAPGQKAQRFEAAGARAVVCQKIAVHVDLVEDQFGDRLVTALCHPRAGEVAAAEVHAHRHAVGSILDRGIEELGVSPRQRRRILTNIGD